MAENRAALLKELPGKPATASIQLGSQRFKALSASAREKYEKQYGNAKQQYEKDLAAFKAAGGEMKAIKKKSPKKEKKTKDPNKPKQPAGGAYGCYLAKHRAAFMKECAGKPITAVTKLAGERWKSLSAAEKKPFEEEFQAKKAAYETAMKDYVPPAGTADGDENNNSEGAEDEGSEGEDDAEEQPPAKNGKTATADETAAEAKKLGYSRQYSSLSENPQVKALGTAPSKILDALKSEHGKAVAAKKALLGGEGDKEEDDAKQQPPAKKAKTATAEETAAEAKSLGYSRQYSTLSENPQVKATPSKILDVLKAEHGKVVNAKKALLGA